MPARFHRPVLAVVLSNIYYFECHRQHGMNVTKFIQKTGMLVTSSNNITLKTGHVSNISDSSNGVLNFLR